MKRAPAWIAAAAICVLALAPARVAAQVIAYLPMPAPQREPAIAIEPIAKQLGWTFKRTATGAILDDGSGPQAIRIGSRLVNEDGADVALFETPAADRNGHIELAISDAATFFHLSVQRDGTHVALVTELSTDVDIREIPRPATPPPVLAATPRPEAYAPPALVQGDAGTLAVSVVFDGSNRVYQTSLSGSTGVVHGAVSSYGGDALTNPVGVVTVGKAMRNIAFGTIDNPLAGSVISNGSLTGATAHLATGNASYDVSSGSSIDGTISAVARTQGNDTDVLAFVSGAGTFDQPILRHSVIDRERWGTLDYEALVGAHGAGAGIHARTNGKTFVDAVVSSASGSLPLSAGDLPSGAVIGEHLSSVTTVTAGYVRSIAAPGSPTVGVTTRWNGLTLGTNVSEHWTNFTASYAGSGAYATFFASAGAQHVFGANGGFAFRGLLAEVDASSSGGANSGIAQLRTNHAGLNLAAGFDLNAGTVRPLAGVVVPLAPSLALEVGVVAGPSGRPALRLAMLAGFRQPKPRIATFPVTVFVPDATHFGALRVFVDGVRTPAPYAAGTPIMVPAGHHSVYAESADHGYASATCDVVVTGMAAKVALTMFPQRAIAGTVSFGGSGDAIPSGASLEGIRVVLEPSGDSATTDVNGRFVFARAPYDPASSILIDPPTVPHGFEGRPAVAIGAGSTDLTLTPQRKVERTTFR